MDNDKLAEKINRMEVQIAQLGTHVDNLTLSLQKYYESSLDNSKEMRAFIVDSKRTNWGTIIAGATLMVTMSVSIIGLIISPLNEKINKLERTVQSYRSFK